MRRLAEEHGVNLSAVQGTGLGGRVTKEDILQYVAQRGAAPAARCPRTRTAHCGPHTTPQRLRGPAPSGVPTASPAALMGDTAMGLTPMRRAIARHMVESVHTSPHAWTTVEIDMTNMVKYRDSIKAEFREARRHACTYYCLLHKGCGRGCKASSADKRHLE